MNRIKDFFYNKNDLIIALLILVLAAGLIYYHVMEIMDYPAKLASQSTETTVTETVADETTEAATEAATETEADKED